MTNRQKLDFYRFYARQAHFFNNVELRRYFLRQGLRQRQLIQSNK